MNNNSRFGIFAAVKNAYLFVGREWEYLLKTGLLPVATQIAVALFIQYQRPTASAIETYLWSLPATLLMGWFLFLETRLMLLGERRPPPADGPAAAARRRCMEASVLTLTLFNMSFIAAFGILLHIEKSIRLGGLTGAGAGMAQLLLIGALFWGARFGVVPILVAVGHPVSAVIKRTWGMMFSLRLIGMAFLSVLPVLFVFQIIVSMLLAGTAASASDGTFHLTDQQQLLLNVTAAPMSLLAAALLNAAGVYALKDILGTRKNGKPA